MGRYRAILRYFIVASTGVLVQLIVSSVAQSLFHIGFEVSIFWGYVVALVVGFYLAKSYVFVQTSSKRELLKYLLVSTLSGFFTVKGAVLFHYILVDVLALESTYFPIITSKKLMLLSLLPILEVWG